MYEKYMIVIGDTTIAMKYNIESRILIVGGFSRFRRMMESIINDYFQLTLPQMKFTQKNKIRFEVFCPKKRFEEGVGLMDEHGIIVTPVTNLGRLMR